ncbi:hypothetical protein [Aureispira anguillae]|uniref:Uncharacterized protein n=1 Tax=Aureispira anguillae TaxID=2864201 RepID=A0A915YG95_9BACT|nr:hypothetical protein [Aureispira anguillae]BDS12602.1 hypothetical protein AsAng_0033260 [Aureispira anguillae]
MNKAIYLSLFCLLSCYCCLAQNKKKLLEDEKIALQFFMDSIYPIRPILKDKILYANGEIWLANFYKFISIIPNYKNVIELYNKEEDSGIYRIPPKKNDPRYKLIGKFKPKKWGLIRKNEDCYNAPKQDPKEEKKPRFPPSGFLNIYSMFYDSTKTEKLVAIKIIINGFSQDYGWASYAFVIKDKKIIYWRWREEEKSRSY